MKIFQFLHNIKPEHEKIISSLKYIPVGLGNENFRKIFSDKTGNNIVLKTIIMESILFIIGYGKNYLDKIETKWIGFCQYRKFF